MYLLNFTGMLKKVFLLFLAFSIFVFSSCGFEDEYSGDSPSSRPPLNVVSEEESGADNSDSWLDEIEGFNYNQRDFIIVTTDGEYFEADGGSSLIEKAVFNRNDAIETKFNVKLDIRVTTDDEIIQNGIPAIKRGERYADLIVASANTLARLAEAECLTNINTLPFFDKTAEYMNEELVSSSEINGKLYLLFGSLTQTEYSSWCVFYNDEIAKKTGIDPFSLYKEGKWDWKAFLEFSDYASKYAESGFLSVAEDDEFLNALWATTGNKFFGECSNTALKLPTVENGKEILSSIEKIIKSEAFGKEHGVSALETFAGGKSAMLLCRRNAVYQICESGMEWSAVPMPKMNGESNHYSYVDGEAFAVAVPSCVSDSDFIGRILNALFISTEKTVAKGIGLNELYYYWSDNETALQMEEVKKNLHLDIGLVYSSAFKDIAAVTTENIKTAFNAGISPFQFYHSTKNQFLLCAEKYFG